jgi:hypothetical protein
MSLSIKTTSVDTPIDIILNLKVKMYGFGLLINLFLYLIPYMFRKLSTLHGKLIYHLMQFEKLTSE